MTNQKLLGALLVMFIIGAGIYFTVTKFKQDISTISASPSPSPADLTFIFNESSQPAQLPLIKNKKLAQFPGVLKQEVLQNKKVVIETAKGKIEIQIFPETPLASSNFILLADNGFYNGLTFHRLDPGFIIQGGDPNGDGFGGPGYTFADEPVTKEYTRGTVAMANSGPNTNGSQFFIMLEDHPELPKQYTIFGQVVSGMDIVGKLAVGDVMQKVIIQNLQ